MADQDPNAPQFGAQQPNPSGAPSLAQMVAQAQAAQGGQPSMPGAAPAPGPQAQAPGGAPDAALIQQLIQSGQMGQQRAGQQLDIANAAGKQATDIATSPFQTPNPRYSLASPMKPISGQGAGGDVSNFFQNLGQALLRVGLATKPGRAIQGELLAPEQHARQAEIQSRATEVSALQKQQQQSEEPIAPLAGMGYKPYSAIGSLDRGQAAMTNAATNQQNAQTRSGMLAEKIRNDDSLITTRLRGLDVKQQQLQLTKFLKEEGFQVEQRGQDMQFSSKEDATAAMSALAQSKAWNELDDSIKARIMQGAMGTPQIAPVPGAPGQTAPLNLNAPPPQGGGRQAPPRINGATPQANAAPARPANVPPDYVYQQNGPQGEGWYKPKGK